MKKVLLMICILCLFSGCGQRNTNDMEDRERKEDNMSDELADIAYASWNDVPVTKYIEKEIVVDYNGQRIWGIAYIPDDGKDIHPLIICSHGLGGSYRSCMEYAELFANHGIAAYCFDFRGGGGNRSDGSILDMSLLTEAEDLSAVIEDARTWDFVDRDKIVLLGESQGGAASTIAAARNSENVNGLILCYPALLVHDAVHEMFTSLDEVPDSYFFEWLTLGRKYAEDVWGYDIYSEIGNYTKPVLLMHGDRDNVVPISYSEKAAEIYPNVEYLVIKGGVHGFYGSAFEIAQDAILKYLQQIKVITQ